MAQQLTRAAQRVVASLAVVGTAKLHPEVEKEVLRRASSGDKPVKAEHVWKDLGL